MPIPRKLENNIVISGAWSGTGRTSRGQCDGWVGATTALLLVLLKSLLQSVPTNLVNFPGTSEADGQTNEGF